MYASLKIDRILFATDFLASSNVALDYAIAFAKHFRATVVMLHALELPYPAKEAETEASRPSVTRRLASERLDALANRARCNSIEVEAYVEEGIPVEVVIRAIEIHNIDLVVLGVHGVHRGLAHLLIGSNTENILRSARCPTMTVGAHVMAGVNSDLHFNEVLYFSDFSPEATMAAPYAMFLSREFQAPIDVCQVVPEIASDNPKLRHIVAEEYCEAMRRLHPEADPVWSAPSFQLDRGREIEEVIERAQNQHAGIIVLGTHTETQLGRHFHTSFAYQLLAKASCPVISIRAGASERE
jgi:nucleotide-binding universal stress UspA family protein